MSVEIPATTNRDPYDEWAEAINRTPEDWEAFTRGLLEVITVSLRARNPATAVSLLIDGVGVVFGEIMKNQNLETADDERISRYLRTGR